MTAGNEPPPTLDGTWIATIRDRIADAAGVVVCFDFDGTLAPIVEEPDAATMSAENRRLLQRLSERENVVVAIVSGRSLADVRERTGLDDLYHAGNHGLEWADGDGRKVAEAARERRPALAQSLEILEPRLASIPGCIIENKGLTATVHHRHTPDHLVSEVTATVRDVADSTPGVRCQAGKELIELWPDVPFGKDRAVEDLRETYPDHVPLFVGDDVTDEDGFEAVRDDGIGILVGDRTDTVASVRIPDTDAVTNLIGWLLQLTGGTSEPPSTE